MVEISVFEKKGNISYVDICRLIHEAHEKNYEKGLIYGTSQISVEKFKNKLEHGTVCFLAIENEQLVGTGCVSNVEVNKWYHRGRVAYLELIAVKPVNMGKGIAGMIRDKCIEHAQSQGVDVCLSISAEENEPIRRLYENSGFKRVGYGAGKSNNFFSIFYVKWFNECPFSDNYIRIRFYIDKILHRIIFMPGGRIRLLWR